MWLKVRDPHPKCPSFSLRNYSNLPTLECSQRIGMVLRLSTETSFLSGKDVNEKMFYCPLQSLSCSSDPPQKMEVESAGIPFPKLDWCLVSFHHVGIQFFAIRPHGCQGSLLTLVSASSFAWRFLGVYSAACSYIFWISLWSTKVGGWTGGISAYLKGLAGRFCFLHNDLYETNWLLKWGECVLLLECGIFCRQTTVLRGSEAKVFMGSPVGQ